MNIDEPNLGTMPFLDRNVIKEVKAHNSPIKSTQVSDGKSRNKKSQVSLKYMMGTRIYTFVGLGYFLNQIK